MAINLLIAINYFEQNLTGLNIALQNRLRSSRASNSLYIVRLEHVFFWLNSFTSACEKPNPSSLSLTTEMPQFFNQTLTDQKIDHLEIVLTAVAEINQELINGNELPAGQIMTTCAIDYGNFTYNRRRQGLYTAKSFFYGQPYLWAYLGNRRPQ